MKNKMVTSFVAALLASLLLSTNAQEVDKAMHTLSNQYYQALLTAAGLSDQTFQLLMTPATPGTTSPQLWSYSDEIPTASSIAVPGNRNMFSQQYSAILGSLAPPNINYVKTILKDDYDAWHDCYKNKGDCVQCADPAKQMSMKIWCQQQNQNYLLIALNNWANSQCFMSTSSGSVPKYEYDIDDLTLALSTAPGLSFTVDSATSSSDMSHVWAQASVSGFWDIFSGGGSGGYDHLTTKFASSHVSMQVSFTHAATFVNKPGCWYYSPALTTAFANNNYDTWTAGLHPNWNDEFGTGGAFLREVANLYVVDGIQMTLSSDSSYSSDEQTTIQTQASGGFWPFFEASGAGGSETKVTFDDSGKMTVTVTNPTGAPKIIGRNVLPISQSDLSRAPSLASILAQCPSGPVTEHHVAAATVACMSSTDKDCVRQYLGNGGYECAQAWLRAASSSLNTYVARGATPSQYNAALHAAKVSFPVTIGKKTGPLDLANNPNLCKAIAAIVDARIAAQETISGPAGRLDCGRAGTFVQTDLANTIEYSHFALMEPKTFRSAEALAGWAHNQFSHHNPVAPNPRSGSHCASPTDHSCGSDSPMTGSCGCVQQGEEASESSWWTQLFGAGTGTKCKVGSNNCLGKTQPYCNWVGGPSKCSCVCK